MKLSAAWEQIQASEGETFDAYVVRPTEGNSSAIVMMQEAFGVNESLRDTADMFAEEGYLVAVPDLFWRIQPHVELDYGEESVKIALSYNDRFDDGLAVNDIAATVRHVRATTPGLKGLHLLGFCMGGRLAVLGTEARNNVNSAISLYGVGIEEHLDVLTSANCPIQLQFAGRDLFVPSSAVTTIEQASVGRNIDVHVYPNAHHGFFPRKRPGHNPAVAADSWDRIHAFLGRVPSQ